MKEEENSYYAMCDFCRFKTLHEEEVHFFGVVVACTECLEEQFIPSEEEEDRYYRLMYDEIYDDFGDVDFTDIYDYED